MFLINSYSVVPQYDPDALAFFNATGITNSAHKDAINTFVLSLKANSIWTPMKGLWIMAGGSLGTCKYNLKDPQDTDAAFRLTYGSNVTAGANGITCTSAGANNAADTHLVPSVEFSTNDISAGCLNHTAPTVNNAPGGSFFGAVGAGSTNAPRFTRGANATTWVTGFGGNSATNTVTSLTQMLSVSNNDTTNVATCYLDGVAQASTVNTGTMASRPTVPYYLLRFNSNGTVNGTCAFTLKFAYVSNLLSATNQADLYSAVTALQTGLGR